MLYLAKVLTELVLSYPKPLWILDIIVTTLVTVAGLIVVFAYIAECKRG